jgi:hypothetical protein
LKKDKLWIAKERSLAKKKKKKGKGKRLGALSRGWK